MATYPLPTLAAVITSTGISAPPYTDILGSLKASFQTIYGSDAYLEADSQDGQLLAIFAQALYDCNQATIAAYNTFSPQTAQGVGLSNVVKINHMKRLIATKSQVNVTVSGVAGTTITNGIVGDANGNRWDLPHIVTIPPDGDIIVTATAEVEGSISAPIHSVTRILTPTAGWQAVTNEETATLGQPVESDADLRKRQQITPAINAYTVSTGLAAALKAISGVTYGTIYENDTDTTDSDGIPGHSISVVIKGGDATTIANTIYSKKGQGVGTYGTTTIGITDISGAVRDISFYVPTEVSIKVAITLGALDGYTTAISDAIKQSVVDYINGADVGEDIIVSRIYTPVLLYGKQPDNETYKITVLQAAKLADSLATTDITIAFSEKAICLLANVTITVV